MKSLITIIVGLVLIGFLTIEPPQKSFAFQIKKENPIITVDTSDSVKMLIDSSMNYLIEIQRNEKHIKENERIISKQNAQIKEIIYHANQITKDTINENS